MITFQCGRCRRVRMEDSPITTQNGEWKHFICQACLARKNRTPHIPQLSPVRNDAGRSKTIKLVGLVLLVAFTTSSIVYLHDIEHFVQTSALSVCRAK